jgi:hypothetical protein
LILAPLGAPFIVVDVVRARLRVWDPETDTLPALIEHIRTVRKQVEAANDEAY